MGDGPIFNQLDRFRRTLANVDEFQKWTGNPGSAELAIAHIHIGELPRPADAKYTAEELNRLRPFCLVSINQNGGFSSRKIANPKTWAHSGAVFAHFEMSSPAANADDHAVLHEDLLTTFGLILEREDGATEKGLLNLFHDNAADYLAAETAEFYGPFFSDPKKHTGQGNFIYALFEIAWGTS